MWYGLPPLKAREAAGSADPSIVEDFPESGVNILEEKPGASFPSGDLRPGSREGRYRGCQEVNTTALYALLAFSPRVRPETE